MRIIGRWSVAAVTLVLVILTSRAWSSQFGLGVILGEPTGISAKAWLSRESAVDAAVAWSVHRDWFLQVHGDLLLHNYRLLDAQEVRGRLPVYYGLGGRIVLGEDDEWVGIRFPLGVSYLFAKAPFDVFFELVPILDLLPKTDLDLDAAIGARFYFGGAKGEPDPRFAQGDRF
jgi:hypothetical protein